jgi:DnaJ-class molecular chaperone
MHLKERDNNIWITIGGLMSGKIICPDCNGNGYLGSSKEPDSQRDCTECNNQGEIEITEETINKFLDKVKTARLQ